MKENWVKKNKNILLVIGFLFIIYGMSNNFLGATQTPRNTFAYCDQWSAIDILGTKDIQCLTNGCYWSPKFPLGNIGDCIPYFPNGKEIKFTWYSADILTDWRSYYTTGRACEDWFLVETENSMVCTSESSEFGKTYGCDDTMKGEIGKAVKDILGDTVKSCDTAFYIGIGVLIMFGVLVMGAL